MRKEISIVKKAKTDNIVRMYDVFHYKDKVGFVIEFCDSGDLRKFSYKHGGMLDEKMTIDIL